MTTSFTHRQSKRNDQVHRRTETLPTMTEDTPRTYGSIQKPVCSSWNQREPEDKPEYHKQKEFLTSHIRESGEIQMMLAELLSRDSSLAIVIREWLITTTAGTGTQRIVQEPFVLIASEKKRPSWGRESVTEARRRLTTSEKGHMALYQEDGSA